VFRTTQDVVELRRWAEAHGVRPGRDLATGRLVLSRPGLGGAWEVGWDEFEPTFLASGDVFVYDEGPGRARWFLGPPAEARAYVSGTVDTGGALR